MKWLVVIALVCGCADHPGTYFDVEGNTVEFFFGTAAGDGTFGAPGRLHLKGTTFERQHARSVLSVAATAGGTKTLTYYAPYTTENSQLGPNRRPGRARAA